MGECSNCHTSFEEGKRFCRSCGQPLVSPRRGESVCPWCLAPVSLQAFCHECGWRLDDAAEPPKPHVPFISRARLRTRLSENLIKPTPEIILSLLAWCLVLTVFVLAGINWKSDSGTESASSVMVNQTPPNYELESSGRSDSPTGSTASTAPAGLSVKEEIETILYKISDAKENRDIDLFMACLSPSFPNPDKKRLDTIMLWQNYEYLHMAFNINDIREEGKDNYLAMVTWGMQVRNLNNLKITNFIQRFKVGFIKEQDQYLIKSLENEEAKNKRINN